MKVKISIEDKHGRNASIEIDESDKQTNLVIIQQVFSLFGVKTDVLDTINNLSRVESAYASFFSEVEPIEIAKPQIEEDRKEEIAEQLTEGLQENKEILEIAYKSDKDAPDWVKTGIKQVGDKKHYRLHYKCIACYNKGTHYVPMDAKNTWCHKCNHTMPVLPAHPSGFPFQDTFGNFYRSGDFQDWNVIATEN